MKMIKTPRVVICANNPRFLQ